MFDKFDKFKKAKNTNTRSSDRNSNRARQDNDPRNRIKIVDENQQEIPRIRIVDENIKPKIQFVELNQDDRIRHVDPDAVAQMESSKVRRLSPSLQKVPILVILLSVAGLFVILFAFWMESISNRSAPSSVSQSSAPQIQAELIGLSWVEQAFLPENEYSRPGTKLDAVNAIVIHNIGNPGTTAEQNRNYFANLATTQERRASSNFIICLDGSIIQCVPVDEVAYASNDRNNDTLSIEICHPDDTGRFTEESYAAAVRLTAWLCTRFDLTSTDLLRHHDIRPSSDCPRYFVNNESAWTTFKADVQRAIDRGRG